MVLLTMTAAVVAVVELYLEHHPIEANPDEPSLDAPTTGNPISHGQLVDISKYLKSNPEKVEGRETDGRQLPIHLSELLKGCSIYTPPLKPKPEPVSSINLSIKNRANNTTPVLRIQNPHGSPPKRRRKPLLRKDAPLNLRTIQFTLPHRLPRSPLPTYETRIR